MTRDDDGHEVNAAWPFDGSGTVSSRGSRRWEIAGWVAMGVALAAVLVVWWLALSI